MDGPESLSKGCFINKPRKPVNPFKELDAANWNIGFDAVWSSIDDKLQELNDDLSSNLMTSLIKYIVDTEINTLIPTAVILTGVNLPDHSALFNEIVLKIKSEVTPNVAHLKPSMCRTLKKIVEETVSQLICSSNRDQEDEEMLVDEDSDEEGLSRSVRVKKKDCHMRGLVKWSKEWRAASSSRSLRPNSEKLIIVLSDLEGFSCLVLKDFILTLSCYIKELPIYLVLGVATSVSIVSDSFGVAAFPRLSLHVIKSEKSVYCLNRVVDEIFLNDNCPFQLGPNLFKFLCNVFLYYDFSVRNFTLGIKYALMDHFFGQPIKLLCTEKESISPMLSSLTKEEMKGVYNLPSFRDYIDKLPQDQQEKLESNVKLLKKTVEELLEACYSRIREFYLCLKLLHTLVCDLPQFPLGKLYRELYMIAITGGIEKLASYKESAKMLSFHSRDDWIQRLSKMLNILKQYDCCENKFIKEIHERLSEFHEEVVKSTLNPITSSPVKSPRKMEVMSGGSRSSFKQAIANLGKATKVLSPFDLVKQKLVHYLFEELMPVGLVPVTSLPLHEIVLCEGKVALRRRIVGCPRAAVHLALTEPQHYLMCNCCKLEDPKEIVNTLPDICILYKLHLECSSQINLYDWLLSFSSIVNSYSSNEKEVIDPQVQARFTQGIAELEFLGFIKTSNRKKDHVQRLTWGGN